MHAIDHFCMLARYNVWATQRLLAAIDTLDDGVYHKDAGLFFKSIHRTLNHMLVGEHLLWYPRFAKGISPKLALDMEAEPVRERLGQALKGGCNLPAVVGAVVKNMGQRGSERQRHSLAVAGGVA